MAQKNKSSEYWVKRFELLEQSQNQLGIDCYTEIERYYRQAQKEIESQIARWYARFADNNGMTMQQARKVLTGKQLEEFKWDVHEYIRHGEENAISGIWAKQLENASARYHISRLEALKLQTQQSLEVLFGNQLDSLDTAMRNIYTRGYNHTAFEIQKGIGVGWDFAKLDDNKISKVISKPWAVDGKNFSQRIWENGQKLVNELHSELTRNIVLGQDPQKAINAIAKKMNTSKQVAGKLVMTEEAFFSSAAQRDCFNELDVEQFEVVATLDSHTSAICQDMDGKHFPMSEWVVGVTAPPFHPWCRTTTVPFFEDDFGSVGERVARDVETGKTYYVPADMTYKEWMQSQDELYGAGTVDKKRKMAYNESADKAQFGRYKERLGADAPRSFADFQKIKYYMTDEYKTLCDFYSYKGRVPEATTSDFNAYRYIRALGEKGVIRVPALPIDVDNLEVVNDHAFNHGCTLDDAKGYITSAKFSITRTKWDGKHINYYSLDGATYLNEDGKVNTIFSKDKFDPMTKEMMKVFQ